jgi:hypothetical protein
MRTVLLMATAPILLWSTVAAPSAVSRADAIKILKGTEKIDVRSAITPDGVCSLNEQTVRSAVIRAAAQTPLKIDAAAPFTLKTTITFMFRDNLCVYSTLLQSYFYEEISIINENLDIIKTFAPIPLYETAYVGTIGSSRISQMISTIEREVGEHIALWLEANSGNAILRPVNPQRNPPIEQAGMLRSVQQKLWDLGLYRGTIDGISGPGTRNGIQQFQRQSGLPVTGELDIETIRRLFP